MTNPVAKLVTLVTVLLGGLVALQGTGLLVGGAAAWVTAAVAVLTAVLGTLTHKAVNRSLRSARGGRV